MENNTRISESATVILRDCLREPRLILSTGIKFEQADKNEYRLTQRGLIDKVVVATGLQNCRPNLLPCSQQALGSDPEGPPMSDPWSYPSVVGMLLYLSCNSRPDIAFAVSQVCRFNANPKQSHASAVKTIVRYLHGTR